MLLAQNCRTEYRPHSVVGSAARRVAKRSAGTTAGIESGATLKGSSKQKDLPKTVSLPAVNVKMSATVPQGQVRGPGIGGGPFGVKTSNICKSYFRLPFVQQCEFVFLQGVPILYLVQLSLHAPQIVGAVRLQFRGGAHQHAAQTRLLRTLLRLPVKSLQSLQVFLRKMLRATDLKFLHSVIQFRVLLVPRPQRAVPPSFPVASSTPVLTARALPPSILTPNPVATTFPATRTWSMFKYLRASKRSSTRNARQSMMKDLLNSTRSRQGAAEHLSLRHFQPPTLCPLVTGMMLQGMPRYTGKRSKKVMRNSGAACMGLFARREFVRNTQNSSGPRRGPRPRRRERHRKARKIIAENVLKPEGPWGEAVVLR